MTSNAHTQRQSNRRSRKQKRKRKHFPEVTGNPRPSNRVLVDAAPGTRRQPFPRISTPPLTELTPNKAADHNYDHLWGLIRQWKATQSPSNLCPLATAQKKAASIITRTTQTQANKEQARFAEEILHPRWIAVQRKTNPFIKPLPKLQEIVLKALGEDRGSIQQSPNFKSTVGDELFASIGEGQNDRIRSLIEYLRESHASEAQWESILWRPWFIKGACRTPLDCDPSDSKPFVGQIVQAKMLLSEGGGVLPPLLASADSRRKSGLTVAPVPWNPNLKQQKGNHILWYPDYLSAVSQSSLKSLVDLDVTDLPAFRIAQYKYLPANWIAEIKAEDTDTNHSAAENYSALMSAYLLHERLLLRWATKNEDEESNKPVTFDDNLAVHCITCCGPVCKIWRMSIRPMKTSSNLEPIRYDMRFLGVFKLGVGNNDQLLCDWINALNALALTVQFDEIIADLKQIEANMIEAYLTTDAHDPYAWTSKIGFVYNPESMTEICAAPLRKLRNAYDRGDIEAEHRISKMVVAAFDETGQALEVPITTQTTRKKRRRDDQSSDTSERGEQITRKKRRRSGDDRGEQDPEPENVWTAQFTEAELNKLDLPVAKRIAQAFFSAYQKYMREEGEDEEDEEDVIGSDRKQHTKYIIKVQKELAESQVQMDLPNVWKDMRLSEGSLKRLKKETLQTIHYDMGEEPGEKATKADLIERLKSLLSP